MTPTSDAQSPLERWLLGLRPVRAVIDNAFRIEDRVRLVRVKLVRKRGYLTVLEPYTGYGTTTWVRALARVHMAPPGSRRRFSLSRLLRRKRRESVVRGWRSFARVSAGNVPATVIIDGVRHAVKADRGGIIDINLPASLPPGWNTITFESFDRQTSTAPVFIVADEQRVGLLSDIDDTVMVTALPRPMLAAWNTFVLDVHARTPTPGMNVLSERILTSFGRSETPVVYLSTGPWNVAPTLARFLGRNLYPAGPLLLTDWGPTPERIFRSGLDHKVSNLDRLAREFPDIKWILVGDDGQHDEQIYGEFTSRHPDRVLAIAIRQLSTSEAVLAGGRAASAHWRKNAPVPWVYAPDGAGLAKQLTEAGILPDLTQAPGMTTDEAPEETVVTPSD
ncbi:MULTISPECIES: App1 family protein [Pseudoclavibacter]|uniref:App1 family protein n=1 Tax=Pseudoclavibacter TaxID=255204 RepID=UPI0021585D45|nr:MULTISPECIES: phosphatase domain-containing protein [Pseudoclavibacter]